jgi:hypothetical protein
MRVGEGEDAVAGSAVGVGGKAVKIGAMGTKGGREAQAERKSKEMRNKGNEGNRLARKGAHPLQGWRERGRLRALGWEIDCEWGAGDMGGTIAKVKGPRGLEAR